MLWNVKYVTIINSKPINIVLLRRLKRTNKNTPDVILAQW